MGDDTNTSAIVSNDGGVTNAYTVSGSCVTHFYTDVKIPTGTALGDVKLLFDWKANGEGFTSTAWDYLRVFMVEPTTTPVAGTQLTTGNINNDRFNGKTTWQSFTYDIPVEYFGTTKRLVFSWRNDGTNGNQPPAAVDNIILMSSINVTSVASVADIEVPYGTAIDELNLPDTLMVTFEAPLFGETTKDLPITWNTGTPTYNGALGEYIFTGTIQLPRGAVNRDNVTATAKVTVIKATPVITKWPVADNAITYGETLSNAVINATEAESTVTGVYTYADSSIYPPVTAGGYIADVVFTPTDAENYNVVTGTMTVTVNKFAIEVIANNITKHQGNEYTFIGTEFTVQPEMLFSDNVASVTLTSDGAAAGAAENDTTGYDIIPSVAVGEGIDNYEISYVNGKMIVTSKQLLSLTGLTISNKEYDRTGTATISNNGTVTGIVMTYPNAYIDFTNAVATFTSYRVGTNKPVAITDLLFQVQTQNITCLQILRVRRYYNSTN